MKSVFIIPSDYDPLTWDNFIPDGSGNWYKGDATSNIHLGINSLKFDFSSPAKKILILTEPIAVIPNLYSIFTNSDLMNKLDLIGTHHKRFCDNKKVMYINPPAPSWIQSAQIYPKSKICSIIASSKNSAPGHKIRLHLLNNLKGNIDKFGFGFNPIEKKEIGLEDYCFSFAIENCSEPGYYTEKILDCFLTGTVPIYWGDPIIENIFDKRGIISYNEIKYKDITFEKYNSMKESIINNFNIAKIITNQNSLNNCLNYLIHLD